MEETLPMRGIAYAKIKGIHLYTCYAPPSDSPEQFDDMLKMLVDYASGRRPIVIGG